ncbi:MAG: AraC family transcriptional regulator [Flammeovirgaceae bacterium]|nr:AraC family transcriptional regulator [Flammeovirgaceae bacterium]MBE62589.1 AraC family transcriptional regulator [Flammeovirgaceae bacterium]|tara:strand:+ start:1467 stop:2339 length:873 start_codon:yes stop_codon:yes gene_type:complete
MKDFAKYLNSGPADRQWGIYLTVAGKYQSHQYTAYPSTDHPSGYYFDWENGRILDEFQLNFITEGKGILETNGIEYQLKPGSLMLIQPGMKHRYKPTPEQGWTEMYVGFNGKLAQHFIQQTFDEPLQNPVIHLGHQVDILDSFQKIFDLAIDQKPAYHQVASGLILKTLGQINAHLKSEVVKGEEIESLINDAKAYMWEKVNDQVDFYEFSKQKHVSYSYFRKVFKLYTDIAPHQFYLDLKIMRAKELILSTDKPIKEITYDLGFESIHYFSRLFKKKTGFSPIEIRKVE